MYNIIMIPHNKTITLDLPDEMVDKKLRIEIYEEENMALDQTMEQDKEEERRKKIHEYFKNHSIDMGGYKFNREELYDRKILS